jgi:hypothetical protein
MVEWLWKEKKNKLQTSMQATMQTRKQSDNQHIPSSQMPPQVTLSAAPHWSHFDKE